MQLPVLSGRGPLVPIYSLPLALTVVVAVSRILSNSSVRSRLSRLGVRTSTFSRRGGFRAYACIIIGGVYATTEGCDSGNVCTMVVSCSRVPIFILIPSFLVGPSPSPLSSNSGSSWPESTAVNVINASIPFDNVNSDYEILKLLL